MQIDEDFGVLIASICILLTMILVMMSPTSALYTGAEQCLNVRYPSEVGAFGGLFDIPRLIISSAVCVLICSIVYAVIYRVTSNAYYRIVS